MWSCESGSYLISRALGPKLGGAVGLLYYVGVVLLAVLEVRLETGNLSFFLLFLFVDVQDISDQNIW